MDGSYFDQLTRRLASNRRQALQASVLGLLGAALPALASDATAARKVKAQGPCGNGGAKANTCRRHRQCCTGYCNKKIRRCRCRRRGQTCRNDRSCCTGRGQNLTCVNGRCQRAGATCGAFGAACASDSTCCAPYTCEGGTCRVDCAATLTAVGCEFLSGPGLWNCGSQDLSGINLSGCDLSGASFSQTNASNATFIGTDLTDANFFGANVTGAVWGSTTCPEGVNSDANSGTCCGQFIIGQTPTGCPA